MGSEVGVDIARALKVFNGHTELANIRNSSGNASRDGTTREEPYSDETACPFHSIDASSGCVKARAVRLVGRSVTTTACILSSLDITIASF